MTEEKTATDIDQDTTIDSDVPLTNLLEEAIHLSCTNYELFKTYCDTNLTRLTQQQQLFLIENGPALIRKNGTTITLTLCNINANDLNINTLNHKIPSIESYRYLLQCLQIKTHQTTSLSSIQITALFMQAIVDSDENFYNFLSSLKLDETSLQMLLRQLNDINSQKKIAIIQNHKNSHITTAQRTNLMDYIKEKYQFIPCIFSDLGLENQYNHTYLKSLILLSCYQKSTFKFYFNTNFIKTQLNQFLNDDKKQFIKQLIQYIDNASVFSNELLILLFDNKTIVIDALFDLITQKIQNIPAKSYYSYHRWDERRIACAKKQFKTGDIIDESRKIQWILALSADEPRCLPITFFRSNRIENNPIILYCKKWIQLLGIQTRPDVHDPLEDRQPKETAANIPAHTL